MCCQGLSLFRFQILDTLIPLFSTPIEIKIPETFFEFMTMSFGHFIFDSNPVSTRIASHTDSDATEDRNHALFTEMRGRSINESQIPPLGDIHLLPSLPFPSLCSFAMINVLSIFEFVSARDIAMSCVDSALS